MEFLVQIDSFLMDSVFEKFSRHFQLLTGKSCFFLAKNCCFAAIMCLLFDGLVNFTVLNVLVNSLVIFMLIRDSLIFQAMERISDHLAELKVMNPLRIIFLKMRLMGLPLSAFSMIAFAFLLAQAIPKASLKGIASAISLLWILLNEAAYYFGSCTPLPPGTSKVRQWIEAVKKAMSPAIPEPEPVMVPVSLNNCEIIS